MRTVETVSEDLLIDRRFCGPDRSGNGGWTAGSLAALLAGAHTHPEITVQLRLPPPLDRRLPVVGDAGSLRLHDGGPEAATVAQAGWAETRLDAVCPPVTWEQAEAGERAYPGWQWHPFPSCFACGPDRAPGDGLRIFPGPVEGAEAMAATWTPEESLLTPEDEASRELGAPIAWAALDCIGGWAGGLGDRAMVLASMTARIDRAPRPGVGYRVVGGSRGIEGRKSWTSAALYDDQGLLAAAEHLWVEVDAATFNALGAQA